MDVISIKDFPGIRIEMHRMSREEQAVPLS